MPKRAWPGVGWRFWAGAGLVGAIVLTCTVNSLQWVGRPFPGFFLWQNLFVPAVGDTSWSGHQAGVPYQSRLLAVNGVTVKRAAEVYAATAKLPVGTNVVYSFAVPHAASPIQLAIPTMRLTLTEYLWTLGNYVAVGAVLTLLGFIVYFLRADAPAARAMLIAGVTWGLHLVTSADIFGPGWFRPLCLILQAIGPVAVLHLALTFPVERDTLKRHPRLLPVLYAVAAVIGVADNALFYRWFGAVIAINYLFVVALIAAGVLFMGFLGHGFFFPPSAAARQRTKIAALGGVVAFSAPVVGVSLYLLGVRFPINYITVPMAVFPAAIAYAIVKHDLFEIDAIIRRTVAWAILTGVVAAIYLGGVGTLELVFTGQSGRGVQVLFLLIIIVLFNPLRNRVQVAVDFLFARDRYDYRTTVAEASQALATLLDLETVVGRILRTITETIRVEFGAVWLRHGDGFRLHAIAGPRPARDVPQRVDAGDPLVLELERRPREVLTQDAQYDGHPAAGRLDAALVMPMAFERTLIGFLALGEKQSGQFFSREDLGLLRTLANQGAVAVENAKSYRALVHANEELQAAQSRLIEAERLAAIGELSAAVAHGIRNPLAGIKAAAQFANLELPPEHPLRENISDIIGEANKLEARIRELLDFAKPFEPRPAPCAVPDIIAGALTSLRPQLNAQHITVVTDCDPALPKAVLDYAQIEQVLLALLSNAVEAMPQGGRLAVAARPADQGRRVQIEVADNGPGIPIEQQQRVFKLFFTTKSSGTGLGLAVVKKIIERHGGTIVLDSAAGQGTRFLIELPVGRPPESVPTDSTEALSLR